MTRNGSPSPPVVGWVRGLHYAIWSSAHADTVFTARPFDEYMCRLSPAMAYIEAAADSVATALVSSEVYCQAREGLQNPGRTRIA